MGDSKRIFLVIILIIGIVFSGAVVFALNDAELFNLQQAPEALSSLTPEEAHDMLSDSTDNTLIGSDNENSAIDTVEDINADGNIKTDLDIESQMPSADLSTEDGEINAGLNSEKSGDNSAASGNVAGGVDTKTDLLTGNKNVGADVVVEQKPASENSLTDVDSTKQNTVGNGISASQETARDDLTGDTDKIQTDINKQSETGTNGTKKDETNTGTPQVSTVVAPTELQKQPESLNPQSTINTPNQTSGTDSASNGLKIENIDNTVNQTAETSIAPKLDNTVDSTESAGTPSATKPANIDDTNKTSESDKNHEINNTAQAVSKAESASAAQDETVKHNIESQKSQTGSQTAESVVEKSATINTAKPTAVKTYESNSSFIQNFNPQTTADKKPASAIATPGTGGAAPTPQTPATAVIKSAVNATEDENVKILVTDMQDKPISGAKIEIPELGIITDSEGIANASLPPGNYIYVIKANGFENLTGKLVVTDKGAANLHFYMKNKKSDGNQDPNARFTAMLVFSNGNSNYTPAENVKVTINGKTYYTNIIGAVVLNDLQPGIYAVQVGGEGYYESLYTLVVGDKNVYDEIEVYDRKATAIQGYYKPFEYGEPSDLNYIPPVSNLEPVQGLGTLSEPSVIPYITQQPLPSAESAPQPAVSAEQPAQQSSEQKPQSQATSKTAATIKPATTSSKPNTSSTASSTSKNSTEPKPTTLKSVSPTATPTSDTEVVAPKNSVNPMASLTTAPSEVPSPEPTKTPESTPTPTATTEGQLFNIGFNITNLNGTAVSGAQVELHSDVIKGTTDSDGYVLFKGVPVGEHNLYIMDELGETAVSKAFTLAEGVKTELDISSVGGDKVFAGLGTDNLTIDAVVDGKLMALTSVTEGLIPKAAVKEPAKNLNPEDNNLMWMLIVSVAAAVIAVIVLLIAIRRMKKSKTIDIRTAEPVTDTVIIAGKHKKGIKLFK